MSLEVLELYGVATLQADPVLGRRKFGVAPGGAYDLESMILANALVGNGWRARTLELGLASITMRATQGLRVAAVGATAEVRVDDGERAANSAFSLLKGQVLKIAPPRRGCRVYLAASGSLSSAGLIRKGSVLESRDEDHHPSQRLADVPESLKDGPLRVLPGPQAHLFDLNGLTREPIEVTNAADRAGIRLHGGWLGDFDEGPSEPACVGAIQATKDGQPLVIGPDGPTIGGYPKIAVVIGADRDRCGQLAPGEKVRFELTTHEDALRLRLARVRRILEAADQLRLRQIADQERGKPPSPIDL